ETVELGGFDQRIDRGGEAAAGIGAGKQIILAANGDTTQSALGCYCQAPSGRCRGSAPAQSSASAYSGRPGRVRTCGRAGARSARPKRVRPRQSALTAAGAAVVAAREVV